MLTPEQLSCMEIFAANLKSILFPELDQQIAWGREDIKQHFETALIKAIMKTVKDALAS